MKKRILLLLLLSLFFTSENAFSQRNLKSVKVNHKTSQLIQNNNRFGLELFKEVAKNVDSSKNFMISPLSATLALAMTYNGAAGTTKKAFENTFHFKGMSTKQINKSLYKLCTGLTKADPKVTFNLANSIWYRNPLDVEHPFLNANKKYYDAEVSALDFGNPNSIKTINHWVEEKTNGKIPSIVRKISPQQIMILINATYFKGNWATKFKPSNTTEEPFTLQNGKVIHVPTMMQKTKTGYLRNDLFTAVTLPYGKGNFNMILMLPNKGKTVKDIENALNQTSWKQWTDGLNNQTKMFIHLPKFKFKFGKMLNEDLSKLGLGIAFSGSANFSKINSKVPLSISMVKQKTYIEVNEEGTEAAAVTAVIMKATAVLAKSIFFNRPFLFAIREKYTGTILFIGRVMDPTKN